MDRRKYLLSFAGVAILSGCSGVLNDTNTETDSQTPASENNAITETQQTSTETPTPPPDIQVQDLSLSSEEVPRGEKFQVEFSVINRGGAGSEPITVSAFGETYHSSTVELNAEGSTRKTVEISTATAVAGDFTVLVASESSESETGITVLQPAEFEIADIFPQSVTLEKDESGAIDISVKNVGEEVARGELSMESGGEVIRSQTIQIEPNGRRELEHEIDADNYEIGDSELSVSLGESEAIVQITVEEPRPEVSATLSIPEPSVVDYSWDESAERFDMSIENAGDRGKVGYGVLVSENAIFDRTNHDLESSSETTAPAGETVETSIQHTPEPIVFFFQCIAWASRADISITNSTDVAGSVEIGLMRDNETIDETVKEIGPNGEVTHRVELERPFDENPAYEVDVTPLS